MCERATSASVRRASWAEPPSSGTGPPRASRSSAGEPSPIAGRPAGFRGARSRDRRPSTPGCASPRSRDRADRTAGERPGAAGSDGDPGLGRPSGGALFCVACHNEPSSVAAIGASRMARAHYEPAPASTASLRRRLRRPSTQAPASPPPAELVGEPQQLVAPSTLSRQAAGMASVPPAAPSIAPAIEAVESLSPR